VKQVEMSAAEVNRRRLQAQRLAGNALGSGAEVGTWMTCTQSQELKTSVRAMGLRTTGGSASVEAAFSNGTLLRSWPMRSTLQAVPAVDLGWMLTLTGARTAQAWSTRRKELGLDDAVLDRAEACVRERLSSASVTRSQFNELLSAEGVTGGLNQAAYVTLLLLSAKGVLAYGPLEDGSQRLVGLESWVKAPVELSPDDALDEWMRRYYASHGPATLADFAWWSSLKVSDARRALARVRSELEVRHHQGVEHFMSASTAAWDASTPLGVLVLPAYDETVLGYKDRSSSIPAAHTKEVIDHGHLKGTVVEDGAVVGTFRRSKEGSWEPRAFTTFSSEAEAALPALLANLGS
jgi:hypothetical protein